MLRSYHENSDSGPESCDEHHQSSALLDRLPKSQIQNSVECPKDQSSEYDDDDCKSNLTEAEKTAREKVLFVSLAVVFVRYGIATFMSPFFPNYCKKVGISGTFEGFIFAAYPLGMAIMGLYGSQVILAIGTRTSVAIGLLFTAVTTSAFGFVPDFVRLIGKENDGETLQWIFISLSLISGLLGSLSDTGVIIVCGEKFKDKSGVVMSAIGTCSGVGCMVGPPLGGVLYSAFATDAQDFRWTFTIWGVLCVAITPLVMKYIPQEYINADEEKAPISSVLSPSVILSLVAIALSGTIVGSLDPTLSYRLNDLSSAMIGLFFMFSSISYTIVGLPIGWATEALKTRENVGDSRYYKLMQAAGLSVLAVAFALLGPIELPFGIKTNKLKRTGIAVVAMVFKGFGSAGNNAGYPDLVLDIGADGSKSKQARIDGMWNAAYAMGWAAGPAVGGGLYDAFGFGSMATVMSVTAAVYALILVIASFTRQFSGGFRARTQSVQSSREAAAVAVLVVLRSISDEIENRDYAETDSLQPQQHEEC